MLCFTGSRWFLQLVLWNSSWSQTAWPTGSTASRQRAGKLCWLMDNSCIDLFKRYSSCHSIFSSCYSGPLCAEFWLSFPLHFWNSHSAASNSFHLMLELELGHKCGCERKSGGFLFSKQSAPLSLTLKALTQSFWRVITKFWWCWGFAATWNPPWAIVQGLN